MNNISISKTAHISTHPINSNSKWMFGFDVVTIWIDRPELPINPDILRKHCTELYVPLGQMKCNSRWKLKLKIHQPTIECLWILYRALGTDIAAQLAYCEIARDLPENRDGQARKWVGAFLESTVMRYQRQLVVLDEKKRTNWYFGRRTNDDRTKQNNVLAVYASRPSKLLNSRPNDNAPPCLHIEWRANGSDVISKLGMVSLLDAIQFDHERFWNRNIRLYKLPRKTDLGRLLGATGIAVSGTALRNRADRWISTNTTEGYSPEGNFILHNALLSIDQVKRKKFEQELQRFQFSDWVET